MILTLKIWRLNLTLTSHRRSFGEARNAGRAAMDDYIERVARAAAEKNGEPVFNGSIDHARVIAEAMFKNAQNTVDIFSGQMNARVYGPDKVVDEAEQFLAVPSRRMRVIVEDGNVVSIQHPLFARLQHANNLEIRLLSPEVSRVIKFHLMVADGDCYRFESDKEKVAAIAAWGDDKGGKNLQNIFNSLWNISRNTVISTN